MDIDDAITLKINAFQKRWIKIVDEKPMIRARYDPCLSNVPDVKNNRMAFYDLTWDNLQLLGQPVHNALENLYLIRKTVFSWLHKLATAYECKLKMVGTDSMHSDMDINVTGSKRSKFVMKAYEILNNVVRPIGKNIEEVFDMNLYVSSFSDKNINADIIKTIEYQRSQRIWAYVHLYEAFHLAKEKEEEKSENKNTKLVEELHELSNMIEPKPLYETAQAQWNQLCRQIETNGQVGGCANFKLMLQELDKCNQTTDISSTDVVSCLSMVQFYSRETYYTRGAYMDVVVKNTNLSKEEYIDSIIDNLAFVVEQYASHHSMFCGEKDARVRYVRKLSKYLYRIFNAFQLIFEKDEFEIVKNTTPLEADARASSQRRKTQEAHVAKIFNRIPPRRESSPNFQSDLFPMRPIIRHETDPQVIQQAIDFGKFETIYKALEQADIARKNGNSANEDLLKHIGNAIILFGASSESPTIIQSIFEIVFRGISLADSSVKA